MKSTIQELQVKIQNQNSALITVQTSKDRVYSYLEEKFQTLTTSLQTFLSKQVPVETPVNPMDTNIKTEDLGI